MKIIVFGLCLVSLVNVCYGMSPVEFGKSVGANENLVNELRDACQSAKDPTHCFGVGLSISNAESSLCNKSNGYHCFGMQSKEKTAYRWVKSYKKYRYKATNGFYFYGDWGELGPSRYCTSEDSSGSDVGCPFGKDHFDTIYNSYKTKVGDKLYTPPLDDNIDGGLINGQKESCTWVGTVNENQYLQLDSLLGQLLEIIRPKNKTKQKLFICNQ